jgi:hypothetical protein
MVKKVFTCVIFLIIMNSIISIDKINLHSSNITIINDFDENSENHLRSLAYYTSRTYSKKILYTKPYKDNNITGTGSLLKDVVYRDSCQLLMCNTACCEGDINSMVCGIPENCKTYKDYSNLQAILGYTLGIGGGLLFFIIGIAVRSKKGDCGERVCFGLIVLVCIIFSPFILIYFLIKCCIQKCKSDDVG